jgi:hypothetical protein
VCKKRNSVILTGPLRLQKVQTVYVEEEPVSAVFCVVETDRRAFGGYHQVMAYGETGAVVAAFWHAGGGEPLDCTVYGWLNTRRDVGIVVAHEVTFHVGPEVAREARRAMESGEVAQRAADG